MSLPMPHTRRVTEHSRPQLPAPHFRAASFGREGYSSAEVDEFVARLQRELRQEPPTLAPREVAERRFAVRRIGHTYSMREVDDYLDVAEELLRVGRGEDVVAAGGATNGSSSHFPTIWIYLVALVLVALLVGFAITQL